MANKRDDRVFVKALVAHDYQQKPIRSGQLYQASRMLAGIYKRAGSVREATPEEIAAHEGRKLPAPAAEPDIDALRQEYERLSGEPPKKVWGVRKLASEILALREMATDAPIGAASSSPGAPGAGDVEADQDAQEPVSEIGGKLL
jgi:hypothetical protein